MQFPPEIAENIRKKKKRLGGRPGGQFFFPCYRGDRRSRHPKGAHKHGEDLQLAYGCLDAEPTSARFVQYTPFHLSPCSMWTIYDSYHFEKISPTKSRNLRENVSESGSQCTACLIQRVKSSKRHAPKMVPLNRPIHRFGAVLL